VEQLAGIQQLVFDKTGTLTQAQETSIHFSGSELSAAQEALVKAATQISTHPLSQMIYNQLPEREVPELVSFTEISGKGLLASDGENHLILGSPSFLEDQQIDITHTPADFRQSRVFVAINGQYLGAYRFENVYRPGLLPILRHMKQAFQLSILSGDSDAEATRLQEALGQDVDLHFKQSPEAKLRFIEEAQQKGRSVLMLGDGLNDAGALQQANVGIAVTENINRFAPGCDAILEAGQLKRLNQFLDFCFSARNTLRWSLVVSFFYNAIGLAFAIAGLLSPLIAAILMPLSSISMVAFVTLLTQFKAKKYQLL
jgi:Cu+-exporting ATPase